MMMTINALCLDSITEFWDWCLDMKRKYGHRAIWYKCKHITFSKLKSALHCQITRVKCNL